MNVFNIDELPGNQRNDVNTVISVLSNKIDAIRDEFSSLLTAKNGTIEDLKRKIEGWTNDSNQYEWKETIILLGHSIPAVSNGENCSNIVRNLVKEKMNIEMNTNEINTAH